MTYFIFILKSAIFDFTRSKGRTFLTSLGILIGVLSVVLLVAFGLGLRKYIQDQFESLGTNLLRVVPGKVLKGGNFSSGSFGSIRFDERDITTLKRLKSLEFAIPVFSKSVSVTGGGNVDSTDVYTSSEEIFVALNIETDYGSLFTKADLDKRAKVVVIGPKLATKLFEDASLAVDRQIKVEGQTFTVVGVAKAKGGGFGGPDFDSYIYMPYKTAYIFNTDKKFIAIVAQARSESELETAKKDISDSLLKRYKEDDFSVLEQTEILNAISSIFNIINLVLVAIAAISLIVGGIGIMNIMYVTVTEKIKEIGIRRAIGARKSDILYLFIVESVVLSLFGGLLGLSLAYIIVLFIQSFFPAYIDLPTVIIALGVSSLIGVIFGVFPAKKAADLAPIDAIRYE